MQVPEQTMNQQTQLFSMILAKLVRVNLVFPQLLEMQCESKRNSILAVREHYTFFFRIINVIEKPLENHHFAF